MNQSVLIINDLSGASKVAANTNIPILAASGYEIGIIPTAILSSNVSDHPVVHTLGTDFNRMLTHVCQLNLPYNGLMSGYFVDEHQIVQTLQLYHNLVERNKQLGLFVDPIMGDGGKLYGSFGMTFVDQMRHYISHADIIFPNLTEACILADYPYSPHLEISDLEEIATRLQDDGTQHVIITGIRPTKAVAQRQIGFYYKDSSQQSHEFYHQYSHKQYMGTGDLAFSIITAFYLAGASIKEAIRLCGDLLEVIINYTQAHPSIRTKGLFYEPFLEDIAEKAKSFH